MPSETAEKAILVAIVLLILRGALKPESKQDQRRVRQVLKAAGIDLSKPGETTRNPRQRRLF